ncbi:hypothetical protein Nepgr_013820 [Nepenthes gracilis]|uniref:Dof zinc finger protein n=1 Tax=Nepenthes gracilis TaxID=150966 RepID=A0AAD3SJK8_NEPGR|nr:hypothetical protein Nepgr_013820 [Nepenthes gracilis]
MDHHQEMPSQFAGNDSMLACSKPQQEKKPRPQEQSLRCPRCESTNTKFCYYNNYSLSQPRYFCKSCRRYWTKGGTLRNVPVGGGCRKNKRSSSGKNAQDHHHHQPPLITTNTLSNHHPPLPPLSYDSSCDDLILTLARLQKQAVGNGGFEFNDHGVSILGNANNTHFDNILGSYNLGGFNSIRGNFLNNEIENLYCEKINMDGREVMGLMPFDDVMTSSATAAATMKQEMCEDGGRRGEEHSRVLWGFPYQLTGEGNMGAGGVLDSVRESWNSGAAASAWHGLLNSPLM